MLEQSQILTTHNLAALTSDSDVHGRIVDLAPSLAERTLRWIVDEQSRPYAGFLPALHMIKNTAYAWRQAVFYLSLCEPDVQRAAVDSLRAMLREPGGGLSAVVDGLDHVVSGGRFADDGAVPGRNGRRFLGWSAGRHWLLPV